MSIFVSLEINLRKFMMHALIRKSAPVVHRIGSRQMSFWTPLVQKPNTVKEAQAHYARSDVSTYLKGESDKPIFAAGAVLTTCAMLRLMWGYSNMANGTNKIE